MTGKDRLREIIHDVEQIEHVLDERVEALKRDEIVLHHLPGDEWLSRIFPTGPEYPGRRAPALGA
jgi:hypothetical protein